MLKLFLLVLTIGTCTQGRHTEQVYSRSKRSTSDTRLVNGPSDNIGVVQIRLDGEWTYVRGDDFSEREAEIVCRSLGYNDGSVHHVIWNAGEAFSDSQGVLRLSGCHPDRDASLAECSSKEVIPVAGVQCDDIQYGGIRLQNSNSQYEGRLEVNYGGVWGTVCRSRWSQDESEVVCRELGFAGGEREDINYYGAGSGLVWLSELRCRGDEDNLDDCNRDVEIGQASCSHDYDVAVRCDAPATPAPPPDSGSGCTVLNDYGTFETPSRPYQNNVDECWILTVSRGQVELSFREFDVEYSRNDCAYDYVKVYDGDSDRSRQLVKLCGSSTPSPVVSSGSSMYVKFYSDYIQRAEGFVATFDRIGSQGTQTTRRPPSDSSCGSPAIPPNDPGSFIVGGREAIPHSHPWIVNVYTDQGFCGGSILSENYVITAAHCVDQLNSISSIRVRVGNHDIRTDERNEREYRVSDLIIHEEWENYGYTDGNDIALLKVREPIEFSDHVSPICLPAQDEMISGYVIVAGWGDLRGEGDSEYAETLQEVLLPVQTIQTCNQDGWLNGIIAADNQICAGTPEGGTDSCGGDSGGPLTQDRDGVTVLYGLVSYGYDSRCAIERKPGVYTRVSEYVNWLYDNSRGEIGA